MPMQPVDPWLSRFAKLLVVATFCLIFLGGMVTSLGAGLSVPDWPTSYGYNMFTFPISRWVGGVRFEHTHRLLATVVGLLTSVLVAWIWRNWKALLIALLICVVATGATAFSLPLIPALAGPEHHLTRGLIIMHVNIWSFAISFVITLLATKGDRWRHGDPWVQWLAFSAFLLVCVQGTLGGLRVTEVSIVLAMIHACTAQAFMCLTVAIATGLSPRWSARDALPTRASRRGIPTVRALAWTLVGAIYCQLIIGAIMRHLHAGLAIPTFPLAFGLWIPPMLNKRVAIHFAHRIGAVVVTLLTLALTTFIFTSTRGHKRLTRGVLGLVGTVIIQICLGAYVIWSGRDPVITSLHVVNGAIVLGKALLLAMRASRLNTLMQPETASWTQYQEAHA
ncbi:MAG TPA: COX15/CtaA family protein [Chthoniobacteraceae bacterium]|nr:COX15/CtaA family protein [Chthoniobacteraceae bacterium]